ncbi:MAG: hypothetical protein HRU30_03420 [Rhodobacteraceae bacterium]|nr:hypothetical protein [Paracoccaceae bacterium]
MTDQPVPIWITYYLWFVSILSAVFAIVIYLNPAAMWSHWEAASASGAFSLTGPTGLFCARNLGTAALGIYALTNKSRPMIEAFLVFRVVVDFLDGTHALIGGNPPIIYIGFGTAALHLVMLITIKRQARSG